MLKPGVYSRLASQIDLAPTLIDLLGAKGEDHFFGQSLFEDIGLDSRAFISNYQELGYYKNNKQVVLSPKQKTQTFDVDPVTLASTPVADDPTLTNEAVSYYQTASRAFKQGDLISPDYKKSNK